MATLTLTTTTAATTTTHLPSLAGSILLSPTTPSHPREKSFALASIRGETCLVRAHFPTHPTTSSALSPLDIDIFKHEFITIFRWSHHTSLHPSDIHILHSIEEGGVHYEEENDTAFVAKNWVEKLRTRGRERMMPRPRPTSVGYGRC